MTRLTRYSEAFWGPDSTSTAGLEALSQRIRDGRNMCKDLEEYCKQRYEMEKSYHRDLVKLQKNMKYRDELGVLERTWNKLRDEVEKMVQIHQDASTHFQRQLDEIKRFSEQQWSSKKMTEEHIKKSQSSKNSLHQKCMNNLKNYKEKCRDKDAATDTHNSVQNGVTQLAKELEKALKQKMKAEDDAQRAENAYKHSLDVLEQARVVWEKDMHEACETFQRLDEERIRFLRENLWVSLNIDSQSAVDIDNSCESVRLVLEHCVVEEDISTYINKHQTGTERPAPLQFESYYVNSDAIRRGQPQRSGGQRSPKRTGNPHNGMGVLDGF